VQSPGSAIAAVTFCFLFLACAVFFVFDGPSGSYEPMQGTVASVRIEVSKAQMGMFFICRIRADNGFTFDTRCRLKPGARVTVNRYKGRITGRAIYRLER